MRIHRTIEVVRQLLAVAVLLPYFALAAERTSDDVTEVDPDRHLHLVRESLVEQAMAEGTRIRSAAWIDQNGVLHENTRFRSDLMLRGIRMPGYLPVPSESEQDFPIQSESSKDGTVDRESGADSMGENVEPPCGPSIDLRSVAIFETQLAVPAQWPGFGTLQALHEVMTAEVREQFSLQPHWRLVEGRGRKLSSPYWSMVEGEVRDTQPLRLTLVVDLPRNEAPAISVLGNELSRRSLQLQSGWRALRDRWSKGRARRYSAVLRLVLHEGRNVGPVWAAEAQFEWQDANNGMSAPLFPPSEFQRLRQIVDTWVLELNRAFACRVPRFPILEAAGQDASMEFVIAAGARAGVRLGDRFVIADGQRVPAAILEEGVAEQMLLGEVVDLQPDRARIRAVAGGSASASVAASSWPWLVALPL